MSSVFLSIIIHPFTGQTSLSHQLNLIYRYPFSILRHRYPLSVLHLSHRHPFSVTVTVTVIHSPLPLSVLPSSFCVWSGCTPYLSRGCMRDFRVCISRWNIYVSRYCGIYICIYVRGGGIHTYKTYFLFLLY